MHELQCPSKFPLTLRPIIYASVNRQFLILLITLFNRSMLRDQIRPSRAHDVAKKAMCKMFNLF